MQNGINIGMATNNFNCSPPALSQSLYRQNENNSTVCQLFKVQRSLNNSVYVQISTVLYQAYEGFCSDSLMLFVCPIKGSLTSTEAQYMRNSIQ